MRQGFSSPSADAVLMQAFLVLLLTACQAFCMHLSLQFGFWAVQATGHSGHRATADMVIS